LPKKKNEGGSVKQKQKKRWTKLGVIGVDAGLCWIGDPCYLREGNAPFENWRAFCDALGYERYQEFNYETGVPGLGIVTSTGVGDGTYPVYGEIVDGTMRRVLIDFWGGPEDEEPRIARVR
jgi:hypothetical protein